MFASLPCSWATAAPTTLSSSSSKTPSRSRLPPSCNATNTDQNPNNDFNTNKFDRRNLLFRLGGLYGAATLASNKPASAAPIPPPSFDTCRAPTDQFTHEVHEYINCCPPLPCDDKIIDYKLPPVPLFKRFRPSAHEVTPAYVKKYNTAVERMKRLPLNDPRNFWQQANVHCAYCNETYQYDAGPIIGKKTIQVHACWLFFPFHRWYLYFYERILGSLIDDPTFGLPFWHWDSPRGMTVPKMYLNPESALFNEHRNKDHMNSLVTLSTHSVPQPPAQTIANNLKIMNDEMIRNARNLECFMGKRYRMGDEMNPGAGTVDRGCHTAVHVFVGDPTMPNREDMGNFYSTGREPMFFAHHANVDRLWSVWKDLRAPYQPKDFNHPDYLNAEFLFYDEEKQLVRVKVGDCLDQERMGYYYQRVDNPWIHYRSPPRLQKSKAVTTYNALKFDDVVFPVKLEKVVKVAVPRPKKSGTGEEEKEEECLLIEGIEVDKGKFVKFDVFVNDEDESEVDIIDRAEYAGTFSQVPHKHEGEMKMKTAITLRLKELFEDLGVDDDDVKILVSLVPRAGDITIGGVKIIYDDSA